MQKFSIYLLLIVLIYGCKEETHFINDKSYRQLVKENFDTKKQILSDAPVNLFSVFDKPLTTEEREAMEFLYAYSPLIDLSFYGGDFLLENVRMALKIREEMPWGKNIPEDIFRHFVLPVRGHNEALDSSRMVFYRELRDRVINCTNMEEAALEVNHWCHEKAIYKPTNARTCAPLTMTTTAYGRCGEESIFALAAMRAVGIPARQVYTPRWAHCDDNHAWIEVWVDGEWKYLGACEPEPRLNIAWFTAPVRRAVFLQARVFGDYHTNEEIVSINPNLTNINVTPIYTDVKPLKVRVQDEHGQAVSNAIVDYRIYNYGEYYPAVTLKTDSKGESSLTVGLGDWMVWAAKGGKYGFEVSNPGEQSEVTVVLKYANDVAYMEKYSIVPPQEKEYEALVPEEERAINDRRFMYEDSVRNAYIATFMSEEEAKSKAKEWGYDADKFYRFVKGARGNYPHIVSFLEKYRNEDKLKKETALDLLGVIAEKDLQDITTGILNSHLDMAYPYRVNNNQSDEYYTRYILNPRIRNEYIIDYRNPITAFLKKESINSVEELINNMQKIKVVDSINTINVATPATGVLNAMVTDSHSKDLFFVAACRTMGVASRLNPQDGKPEYYNGQEWIPVVFSAETVIGPKGKLMVKYEGNEVKNPAYYTHFTISKIENGRTKLIDLGSNADVDMGGGASYQAIFRKPVELEEGDYILVTGNRASTGAVKSVVKSFTIYPDVITDVEMEVVELNEKWNVLGNIQPSTRFMAEGKTTPQKLIIPNTGYTAICFVAANSEPSNHLLRDMTNFKDDFENMGVPLMFLFKDKAGLERFSPKEFRPFPDNMIIGYDYNNETLNMLSEKLELKNIDNFPLIVVTNAKGEVVFISQGYRIGLGNQILKFMTIK